MPSPFPVELNWCTSNGIKLAHRATRLFGGTRKTKKESIIADGWIINEFIGTESASLRRCSVDFLDSK